jgi:hypothetical protein
MSRWKRFFPILWAVSWVWWLFPLQCRSLLVWCNPICSLFCLDAEPFKFCLGSSSLYLSVLVFLLLPGLVSKFQALYFDFKLILVHSERQGSSFSLLHVDIQFSQQHLWKRQPCLIPDFTWSCFNCSPLSMMLALEVCLCLSTFDYKVSWSGFFCCCCFVWIGLFSFLVWIFIGWSNLEFTELVGRWINFCLIFHV